MVAARQQVIRMRGAWALGMSLEEGDVTTRGRNAYRALVSHLTGRDSEPGHGSRWTEFFVLEDASMVVVPSAQASNVVALPSVQAPTQDRTTCTENIDNALPAASQIVDDRGGVESMNLAFTIDALEHRCAALEKRLELKAVAKISFGPLWDQKAIVLGVETGAEALVRMVDNTREMMRLMRIRDKGLSWSPQEAARMAVLEEIDRQIVAIDERSQ